jgi:hypothetical protein
VRARYLISVYGVLWRFSYANRKIKNESTECLILQGFRTRNLSFGLGDALNLFNHEAPPLAAERLRKAKSSCQQNGGGAGVRLKKGNIELRLWLSGPRIGWFRPGISP